MCRHPNIVPVLYVSTDQDLCLVMPLMPDRSLEHLLQERGRRDACDSVQRLRYARDMFAGIAYLHTPAGRKPRIVHRDIKTQNVLLHGNVARVSDVGIARPISATLTMTRAAGTALFIDPEYARTQVLGPASDVYGVGVVTFMLLSGADETAVALSFVGEYVVAQRWEVRQCELPPQTVADSRIGWPSDIAARLHQLARTCVAQSQRERPASGVVHRQLEAMLTAPDAPEAPASECMICMSGPREGLFRPCGHNVACRACAELLRRGGQVCPICREEIRSFEAGSFTETFPGR